MSMMMTTTNDEFDVYLISTASMDIFSDNTMAAFTNRFSEPLNLSGDWRVALTEIAFPTAIKNVTDSDIYVYVDEPDTDEGDGVIRKPRTPKHFEIPTGIYKSAEDLLDTIRTIVPIAFTYTRNANTGLITINFNENEGLTFGSNQVPSLLGFEGIPDYAQGIHIGYKQLSFYSVLNRHTGSFPADMTAGTHFAFIYLDVIKLQTLGDTKAPVLRVINCDNKLKISDTKESTHSHKSFSNLQYKKLLKNNIGSIHVEIRSETGKRLPFIGTGKVFLALNFKKFK